MRNYLLYCILVITFSYCGSNECEKVNILKKCNIEKLELICPYLRINNNKLVLFWKELNKEVKAIRIIPKDTNRAEREFFVIFRDFYARYPNCIDDFNNYTVLAIQKGKIYIFRHNKKRQIIGNPLSLVLEDDSLTNYVNRYKGEYIQWIELKNLLLVNQEIVGLNNKVDSIEFVLLPNGYRSSFLRYYSKLAPTNSVSYTYLPFDTVINYPLTSLVSRFYSQ